MSFTFQDAKEVKMERKLIKEIPSMPSKKSFQISHAKSNTLAN